MTVTRQSLRFKCSVKDCPWPRNQEMHVPWCLGIPDVEHWADKPTHQHIPKKGMGGKNSKSKIWAILCLRCHDIVDNGFEWGNAVIPDINGRATYMLWDVAKGVDEPLIVRPLSDGAEAQEGSTDSPSAKEVAPRVNTGACTSAPSLNEEESDGLGLDGSGDSADAASGEVAEPRQASASDKSSPVGGSVALDDNQHRPVSHSGSLTHDQRVVIAQQIKDAEWNRQWIAGDTGNAWIAELGEEAEQYLSDFGYVHESLANILRVCAAIPPPYRNGNLRYSHHVVVAKLNHEDMEMWLGECEDNQWSVATFREAVHGLPAKIKRWALEELLEGVEAWPHPTDRPRPRGAVRAYLKWLGEQ